MRSATFVLALLGLLAVGTMSAVAAEPWSNGATAPGVTAAADQVTVTPVRWYGYRPAWGYGYYRYPRYYNYDPYYGWYGPRRYYSYYPGPYPSYGYYAPYGFEYSGPQVSFGFGF